MKPGKDVPKDAPVPRRFPVVLAGTKQQPLGNYTKQSGRLELAEWLADAQNPITARPGRRSLAVVVQPRSQWPAADASGIARLLER